MSATRRSLLLAAALLVPGRMGVITATFGGLLRDLLGGDSPGILSREIYASAAAAGAAAFVALTLLGAPRELAIVTGFFVALLVRAAPLRFGWTLPRYRPRADLPSHTLSD